ncbi:hypothetical protein JXM67_02295 [candidate division WOR-3 bacterium]|nr:hypothetical protein [candidate division WOR-3 bacterium]
MACDTGPGGSFVVDTLTQDASWHFQVVLQLNSQDQPRLAYLEAEPEGESFELRYGWLEEGELVSEAVTELSPDYDPLPLDMVIDEADMPHVFYTDYDKESEFYCLYIASVSSQYTASWESEEVSDSFAALPSAAFDALGDLAVAYCTGEDLDKIVFSQTNAGGWEEEIVAQKGEIDEIFQDPSLDFNSTGIPYI